MVCAFSCGDRDKYGALDDYIQQKARCDNDTVSYLIHDEASAVAIFALSCTALTAIENGVPMPIPAVEIRIFALDEKYQHTSIENSGYTIGDFVLSVCLEYIQRMRKTSFGASNAVLYANSEESQKFYRRNGFYDFEEYMQSSSDPFLDGCFPMYLPLDE